MYKYLIGLSFTYGCYRGWTIPFRHHNQYDNMMRCYLSLATGVKYVVPPFCIVKYVQLLARVYTNYYGISNERFPSLTRNIYQEWGIPHPDVI
jgi:hypothetical protein